MDLQAYVAYRTDLFIVSTADLEYTKKYFYNLMVNDAV